jgi:hypothetical protein
MAASLTGEIARKGILLPLCVRQRKVYFGSDQGRSIFVIGKLSQTYTCDYKNVRTLISGQKMPFLAEFFLVTKLLLLISIPAVDWIVLVNWVSAVAEWIAF